MGSFFSKLLLALLFILPSALLAAEPRLGPDELVERARAKRLWENQQWIYLLHYKNQFFGGKKSEADGQEFFFAPDGKTNPEAELLATIRAYFREPTTAELAPPKELTAAEIEAKLEQMRINIRGTEEQIAAQLESRKRELLPQRPPQHPVCQFPARLRFLQRELGWNGEGVPKVTCHRLDDFRRRLDAQSVSLVFSSFYLNNPSSTFGHSFIRINSGNWSQYGNYRNELLDTGINYAADGSVANPVLYAVFGMAGLLPGSFTAVPYYYKVREYNDFETRDLWSYDLALSKEEVSMLVDHIWEEGSTSYDYYYFTENCSYHMFTLLDAAAPRLRLQEQLPYYVIPSDTIRALNRVPGLVERTTYRPSIMSQFRYRLEHFDPQERKSFDAMLDAKSSAAIDTTLSKTSQAALLDAYSDQVELTYGKDLMKEGSEAQKLKQEILVRRASLGVKSPKLEIPPPDRSAPHLAHGIRRVSLGYASEKGQKSVGTFGYKFAMHEVLDPGLGYARNMQIDFAQVHFRYRDRIEFDEINVFKLTALTPYSRYYSSKSVRAEFGWKKTIDRDCENSDHRCLPLTLEYAPGISFDPTQSESLTFFALFGGRFEYSPRFVGSNFRVGAGPRVGALVHFSDTLRFQVASEIYGRLWAREDFQYSSDAMIRWGFKEGWAVDLGAKRARDWSEAASRLHFYF